MDPCPDPNELVAWLEGQLGGEARARMEEHLDACADCRHVVAEATSEVPSSLAGRFRIVGELGRGGMGVVYDAIDLELDQPVALKMLAGADAGLRERGARMREELVLARRVTHPGVCRVHDVGVDGEVWFMSMERVDGQRLSVACQDPHSTLDVLAVTRQLIEAVAAIHAVGLVHRDVKLANVMLERSGRVVLLDFGLAAHIGDSSEHAVGTTGYAAPEQLSGRPAHPSADVFALGRCIERLWTLRGRPLGPSLRALLQRCLSPRPEDRPADASVLHGAYAAALEHDGTVRRVLRDDVARWVTVIAARDLSEGASLARGWTRDGVDGDVLFTRGATTSGVGLEEAAVTALALREHAALVALVRGASDDGSLAAKARRLLDLDALGVVTLPDIARELPWLPSEPLAEGSVELFRAEAPCAEPMPLSVTPRVPLPELTGPVRLDVLGAPGSGLTTLLCAWHRVTPLAIALDEPRTQPLSLLRAWLVKGSEPDGGLERACARLARDGRIDRAVVREVLAHWDGHPSRKLGDGELLRVVEALLGPPCATRTLLVDDAAEWDPESLALLAQLLARGHALRLVLGWKPTDVRPAWPGVRVEDVALAPLEPGEAVRLVRAVSPLLDEHQVHACCAVGVGNPRLVWTAARLAAAGLDVERAGSIQALVQLQFDHLDDASRRALKRLAILDEPFDRATFARVAEEPGEIWNRLVVAGWIELSRDGLARALPRPVRDTGRLLLGEPEARAAHGRVAQHLVPSDPLGAARHFLEASERERCMQAARVAGERADRGGLSRLVVEAFELVERAGGQLSIDEGLVRARALLYLGRHEDRRDLLATLRAGELTALQRAEVERGLAYATSRLGHAMEALEHAELARAATEQAPDPSLEARLHAVACHAYHLALAGRIEEARRRLEAFALLPSDASVEAQMHWFDVLGWVSTAAGQSSRARRAYEVTVRLCDRGGLVREGSSARSNLGSAALRCGRVEEAIAILGEALVLSRQLGNRVAEAYTLANLARAHRYAGDRENAQRARCAVSREVEAKDPRVARALLVEWAHDVRGGAAHDAVPSLAPALARVLIAEAEGSLAEILALTEPDSRDADLDGDDEAQLDARGLAARRGMPGEEAFVRGAMARRWARIAGLDPEDRTAFDAIPGEALVRAALGSSPFGEES